MNRILRQGNVVIGLSITLAALASPIDLTYAQYGTGWACERGYRADGETCVRIDVPKNAYFVDSSYGPGWSCERGYSPSDGVCITIELPVNAHLGYSGNDWDCDRPFRRLCTSCGLVGNNSN